MKRREFLKASLVVTWCKNWGQFGGHPDWKKLSTTPGYTNAEILTNITSVFLRPTGYSQV